ncbi:MAG: tRNA (guanosine(37)-N1)-methyltransferase TrmD [bacterium]
MRFDVLTLFPEMFQGPLNESLLKKAQSKGLLSFNLVNIRDFATDKHKTVDDTPYGGGAGMVMKVDVVARALRSVVSIRLRLLNDRHSSAHRVAAQRRIEMSGNDKNRIILLCPTGKPLTQAKVNSLAKEENLVLVCGHYEGFDDRIRAYVDEEISIGDYVLTGGELPAMVLIDAIARQLPGVVKETDSVANDSFFSGLLDYPSFTRPEEFEGKRVPDVLLSGNHAEIKKWRETEALKRTKDRRPDLLNG